MKFAFFALGVMASTAAVGSIPIDGWYSSVFAGYSSISDNLSITRNFLSRNRARYEGGYHVGGRLGYQCEPLRFEGEVTYLEANLDKFKIDGIEQHHDLVDGETSAWLGMVNAYYDFPEVLPAVQPFLGVGLGYGSVEGSFRSRGFFFGPTSYSGSNYVFGYQVTGGLTYNLCENYALNIAYRYLGTDHVHNLGKVLQANLGTIGMIYRFNASLYK